MIDTCEVCRPELLAYATCRVGATLANDMVQKAFIVLMQCTQEVEHPRAFLYKCLKREIASHTREENRRQRLAKRCARPLAQESPDTLCHLEQIGKVKAIIGTLPRQPVVSGVLLESQSAQEVAKKHGLTEMAVRQVVERARKATRGELA